MITNVRPVMSTPLPPRPSLKRRVEEEVADAMVVLGHVGPLRKLFYWVYDHMTRPKANTPATDNLGDLSPTVMRGAQPTEQGFKDLAARGVKTVINLRPEEDWERPMVAKAGQKYLYMPLPAVGAPSIQQGVDFLKAATDPANGKVFFHCLHGADRTGAMAAIYRIAVQGWGVERALAEMPQYRYHAGFEDEKMIYVQRFAAYWQGLPAEQKAAITHQAR
jgi:protein tyrosine/serine phosphatase